MPCRYAWRTSSRRVSAKSASVLPLLVDTVRNICIAVRYTPGIDSAFDSGVRVSDSWGLQPASGARRLMARSRFQRGAEDFFSRSRVIGPSSQRLVQVVPAMPWNPRRRPRLRRHAGDDVDAAAERRQVVFVADDHELLVVDADVLVTFGDRHPRQGRERLRFPLSQRDVRRVTASPRSFTWSRRSGGNARTSASSALKFDFHFMNGGKSLMRSRKVTPAFALAKIQVAPRLGRGRSPPASW